MIHPHQDFMEDEKQEKRKIKSKNGQFVLLMALFPWFSETTILDMHIYIIFNR